jgi:hypothetical protein
VSSVTQVQTKAVEAAEADDRDRATLAGNDLKDWQINAGFFLSFY